MNHDDKFWLLVLVIFTTFILLFTLIFVVDNYEETKMMVEAGYEQVWNGEGHRTLWRKVRHGDNNTN